MTVQEMIIEVYGNLQKPSDLLPYEDPTEAVFDMTSSGAIKILGYLNRAYDAVLNYKFGRGRLVKFNTISTDVNFKTEVISGTASDGDADEITLEAGSSSTDDYYNNYTIKLTGGTGAGQIRVIMDYTGSSLVVVVNRDWVTEPDATTTYSLYRNFYSLSDIGISDEEKFFTPLKLLDIEDKIEVMYGSETRSYVDNLEQVGGSPTEYIYNKKRIYFNYPVPEAKWYQLEYRRLPDDLVLATDEPEIPETFHDALILYATWLELVKYGENGDAYARKQDFKSRMESIRQENEGQFDRNESGFQGLTGTNYFNDNRR